MDQGSSVCTFQFNCSFYLLQRKGMYCLPIGTVQRQVHCVVSLQRISGCCYMHGMLSGGLESF